LANALAPCRNHHNENGSLIPFATWWSSSLLAGLVARRLPCTERRFVVEARETKQKIYMDYIKPAEVVENMIKAGTTKGSLPVKHLLIRGMLSGGLLGIATSLAISASVQTTMPIVGAAIFPVGFVIIVLLGLELVTGSFALVPLAMQEGKISARTMLSNLFWVFTGNLIGSVIYAGLLYIALTMSGSIAPDALASKIIAISEAKTLGYAKFGAAGMLTSVVKAILCNWMVTLGVVMAMTSHSTVGKIVAAWLPIFIFFAQGFEHAVVNMFVIPLGMMLGAKVSFSDWWVWNQIPVTIGNFIGGFLFTGLALYLTHGPKPARQPAIESGEMIMAK
jgi:formate/nitrite transporter